MVSSYVTASTLLLILLPYSLRRRLRNSVYTILYIHIKVYIMSFIYSAASNHDRMRNGACALPTSYTYSAVFARYRTNPDDDAQFLSLFATTATTTTTTPLLFFYCAFFFFGNYGNASSAALDVNKCVI